MKINYKLVQRLTQRIKMRHHQLSSLSTKKKRQPCPQINFKGRQLLQLKGRQLPQLKGRLPNIKTSRLMARSMDSTQLRMLYKSAGLQGYGYVRDIKQMYWQLRMKIPVRQQKSMANKISPINKPSHRQTHICGKQLLRKNTHP